MLQYTIEEVVSLNKKLPSGAKKKIAQNLSVGYAYVRQVLTGKVVKFGQKAILIIEEAKKIINEVIASMICSLKELKAICE